MALQKRLAAENLLGFMVGDFADKMRGIGRMDLLDGISNKALEYFSDDAQLNNDLGFAANFQHAQTLEAMGEVAYSRNKLDEANSAFHAARNKLTALLEKQPHNLELLKTLGANAFWIGQLDYDNSDWDAARVWWEIYKNYSQTMFDIAPDDTESLMELSYAQNSLGSVSVKQQDFITARRTFETSLELKLLALKNDPSNSQLTADVADTRSWLAGTALALGDINAAVIIHKNNQDLLKDTENKTPYTLERLSSSHKNLAYLYHYLGQNKKAFQQAKLSYSTISAALKQDPNNSNLRTLQYYSYFAILIINKEPLKVKHTYHPEIISARFLSDKTLADNSVRQSILTNYHFAAAHYYFSAKDYQSSLSEATLATNGFKELVSAQPLNSDYLGTLSASQILQTAASIALDNKTSIIETCKQVKFRLESIITTNKSPRYTVAYAKALACLDESNEHSE